MLGLKIHLVLYIHMWCCTYIWDKDNNNTFIYEIKELAKGNIDLFLL
jgi:hypothetical protein